MEMVGYLGDAHFGGLQQECCFHHQHLIDIVDDGATRDLTDHAREIDGRDMELVGIEGNVVVLGKVAGQQTDETDENLFYTLGLLNTRQSSLCMRNNQNSHQSIRPANQRAFFSMLGMSIV